MVGNIGVILHVILRGTKIRRLKQLGHTSHRLTTRRRRLNLLGMENFFMMTKNRTNNLCLISLPPTFTTTRTRNILMLLQMGARNGMIILIRGLLYVTLKSGVGNNRVLTPRLTSATPASNRNTRHVTTPNNSRHPFIDRRISRVLFCFTGVGFFRYRGVAPRLCCDVGSILYGKGPIGGGDNTPVDATIFCSFCDFDDFLTLL